MGDVGDTNRGVFAEVYDTVGLDFTLEEQARIKNRAGTQNRSPISNKVATETALPHELSSWVRFGC